MSTDDEFARSLRERADAAVPAMSVDPVTTLHLGRRRVRARHAWQVGSVVAAVGVVAVAVAPTLPGPRSTSTDATAQIGVSSSAPTPRPSSTFTTRAAAEPDPMLASAPGGARIRSNRASVLGASVVAQANELQQDMLDALDAPYDVTVWDDFDLRLDALVTKADAANARHPHSDAVELGYFVFPERYTHRLTSWIGWDNANRVTLAWIDGALQKSTFTAEGVNGVDRRERARGKGSLGIVEHKDGTTLADGSELTYQDATGETYRYDVFDGWQDLGPVTDMFIPPLETAYTVDISPEQRSQLDSLSAQAMSSGSGLAAENDLEPLMNAVAATRHPKKDTGDHDVVSAGLTPFGIDAPHATLMVPTKHAQWNGWVDGLPTAVVAGAAGDPHTSQPTSTGQIRLVRAGDQDGVPYSIKGTGSLTLESESQGVLTLRDSHGATHRFDLATMTWQG